MERLHGTASRPRKPRPTVVTVGTFDGVHRGHQALHERTCSEARRLGAGAAIVTMDRHPLETLAPQKAPCLLTTLSQRLELFEAGGFETALVLEFDDRLARMEAPEFVRAALVDSLQPRKLVVGEDFRFGRKRAGDVELLAAMGRTHGFEVEALPLVQTEGEKISSSEIRDRLAAGEVERAAGLLGRSYRLAGEVVGGEKRGRKLGFPTANLRHQERACLPALGVYAGWWLWRGQRLPGVINVGIRPTFEPDPNPVVEIYVLEFDSELYGESGEIEFQHRLREERRYPSVDALVEQIHKDVEEARALLGA